MQQEKDNKIQYHFVTPELFCPMSYTIKEEIGQNKSEVTIYLSQTNIEGSRSHKRG